jgi:short-subunit dehydrogenase
MDRELRPHGVAVSVIHPPAVRTSFADEAKADLRSTLVLRLFPSVSAATVARVMPCAFDLAFMSLLFKGRRKLAT